MDGRQLRTPVSTGWSPGQTLAVFVPALMWSSMHVPQGIIEQAVLFVYALFLGVARWRTGSLWTAILMNVLTSTYWWMRITPLHGG